MPQNIRLNVFLSRCGICSRREADQFISEGRVSVNGNITTVLGTKVILGKDKVKVDGIPIKLPRKHSYFILNKPTGVVTTLKDPKKRRDIGMFIKEIGIRLYPIGRLDYNSEGLLILTDDGELAHRIQHPRYKIQKEYLVTVDKPLSTSDIANIRKGIELDDGFLKVLSIKKVVGAKPDPSYKIIITEGRNRIIRRLFEKLGFKIVRLERISIGGIRIGKLKVGAWRKLRAEEIVRIKKLANLNR